MTSRCAIGLDLGGSSVKAVLYRLDGQMLGYGRVEYQPRDDGRGAVEYAPAELLGGVDEALRLAVSTAGVSPRAVVAIATDAMISGVVGIGEDGGATTSYTTTLDTRFNDDLAQMVRDHGRAAHRIAGSSSPVMAAKMSWYRRTDPEAYERTSKFVTAGGLAGAHLAGLQCGETFVDETVLWATGLADARLRRWDQDLMASFDVQPEKLPLIRRSTEIVGGLVDAVAQRSGLRPGTPVVVGMGDQMAGFLGAGLFVGGRVADSSGTFSVVGRRVESFQADQAVYDVVPSPLDGGFVQQCVAVIGAGYTRLWQERLLGLDADRAGDGEAAAAQIAPGSDGLVMVPHLGGQANPERPWLRGAWLGLEWGHRSAHFVRALAEAAAYELARAIDVMASSQSEQVVGYGGGTSSRLASQIKADVTGRVYRSLGDASPAAAASALFGAYAVGELPDIDGAVEAATGEADLFRPSKTRQVEYQELRRRYAQAVEMASTYCAGQSSG